MTIVSFTFAIIQVCI